MESVYVGLRGRSFDEGELEEIREFAIEEEFGGWDVEIREDAAEFVYDDGNDYEFVRIEPMESEYGGKYYVVTAFSASWHDRIYHCGECFECVGAAEAARFLLLSRINFCGVVHGWTGETT